MSQTVKSTARNELSDRHYLEFIDTAQQVIDNAVESTKKLRKVINRLSRYGNADNFIPFDKNLIPLTLGITIELNVIKKSLLYCLGMAPNLSREGQSLGPKIRAKFKSTVSGLCREQYFIRNALLKIVNITLIYLYSRQEVYQKTTLETGLKILMPDDNGRLLSTANACKKSIIMAKTVEDETIVQIDQLPAFTEYILFENIDQQDYKYAQTTLLKIFKPLLECDVIQKKNPAIFDLLVLHVGEDTVLIYPTSDYETICDSTYNVYYHGLKTFFPLGVRRISQSYSYKTVSSMQNFYYDKLVYFYND